MIIPGQYSKDIVWYAPVTVGTFTVNSLKEMDFAKYNVALEPVIWPGIDKLPRTFEDGDYPPTTFEATDLVSTAVPVDVSAALIERFERFKDEKFKNMSKITRALQHGSYIPTFPSPTYLPSYLVPKAKSVTNIKLPDCRL